MKITTLLLLFVMLAFCGCTRRYVMKLSNGSQVATTSKPQMKNGAYYFRDVMRNETSIPAGRVVQISPASMAQESSPFKPLK